MLPGGGSLRQYEGHLLLLESNRNRREARRAGEPLPAPEALGLLGLVVLPMPAGPERRLSRWAGPTPAGGVTV